MHALESHMEDEPYPAVQIRGESLEQLEDAVSQYLPTLYRRAYRYVGDPHDAEDAVQDALLSAYKHLDQFNRTSKMTTWLTTIVTNSALGQLRRRPHHPHVSLDERVAGERHYCVSDRLADVRPSPEGQCIRSELHGRLMQSVMELSPSLRKAIQLCDLDGLTIREVARIVGVPHGTMKARVWRARLKLKRMMSKAQEGEVYANELCTGCKAL
jgi:RNA polymerase sigma-70 factor, ECF subfamily